MQDSLVTAYTTPLDDIGLSAAPTRLPSISRKPEPAPESAPHAAREAEREAAAAAAGALASYQTRSAVDELLTARRPQRLQPPASTRRTAATKSLTTARKKFAPDLTLGVAAGGLMR